MPARKLLVRTCCVVTATLCGWTQFAAGDELTEREKDLMNMIESLKARVSALEAQQSDSANADRPALSERVATLESAAEKTAEARDNDFRVYWDSGLNFKTNDGATKLKIGGRIHNDWYWYDQDQRLQRMTDLEDGTEFRRARLYLSVTLYENVKFKAQYDFADGDADFKDVYMELNKIPGVGNVRIGHFKEPFSLEEMMSSNNITFMERALPNVFAPSRNTGLMVHRPFFGEKGTARMTAALGIFHTTDNYGNAADDGGYSATARVTGLPWYKDEGRKLIHLGAAYSHRNPDGDIRIRQRPESHDSTRFVDTGTFEADDIDSLVLEGALVYDRFSVQGEYFHNTIDTKFRGEREFDGYYVQASVFLTGEHRRYKHSEGKFVGLNPLRNFRLHGDDRGWGAWEVALRYSSIDLDDGHAPFWEERLFGTLGEIRGGKEDNVTLGLNWYLNPNARIMMNYIIANLDSEVYKDDLNIFQTRFQVNF